MSPFYDFRCIDCDEKTEAFQRYDDLFPECPKCKREMKRMYSVVNFKFKGSGFYSTDYKSGVNDRKEEKESD